ncbi:MAG: cytochrome P450, partial [Pseudomonadota bacterium]|nr:cytochrome P450 [Pseudomonadota bacterium]
EVDSALNQAEGGIDPAFIRQMPRTKALVQEILRLYPSAWWFARQALTDDVIDGVPVKKGSSVLICPWVLHRHPDLWSDPEKLDPERFMQDQERDKFSYIPFGAGSRMCIGAHLGTSELVGIAAAFVSAFELKALSGPLQSLKPYGGLTLALPDGGLKITLKPRPLTGGTNA